MKPISFVKNIFLYTFWRPVPNRYALALFWFALIVIIVSSYLEGLAYETGPSGYRLGLFVAYFLSLLFIAKEIGSSFVYRPDHFEGRKQLKLRLEQARTLLERGVFELAYSYAMDVFVYASFDKAVRSEANSILGQIEYVKSFKETNRQDKKWRLGLAIKQFDEAIALDSENKEASVKRDEAYQQLKEYQENKFEVIK